MRKTKNILLFLINLIICLFLFKTQVFANYLEPQNINGEDCYNIYDILKIKNGTYQDISDDLLGTGKSFYLNNNLLNIYKNSIVYKINETYKPIKEITYSIGNNKIILPDNEVITLNDNEIYFNKNDLKEIFSLDIESQGIYYENIETSTKEKSIGVSFDFLKNNITTLGYVYLDNGMYQYYENDNLTNIVTFKNDNEISIQYYLGEDKETLNLLLKSLFPNSYTTIINALETQCQLNGVYDGIKVESFINDNCMELQCKY